MRGRWKELIETVLDVGAVENFDGDDRVIDNVEHDEAGLGAEHNIRVAGTIALCGARRGVEMCAFA